MNGTRVPDGELARQDWPDGGYGRINIDGEWSWAVKTPTGIGPAFITKHTVEEHDDGTITVTPSIVALETVDHQWHGFLERGVWREV